MVQTVDNIKEWAKGRYAIYTYLSDCYLDIPSKDTIDGTCKIAAVFSSLAENVNESMQDASRLLEKFVTQAKDSAKSGKTAELLEKLNMEYTALFMMGDLSIAFFESAFLGGTDTQKSEIRMDVYHFFMRRQFERRGMLNIPEDALCHELDYMAKMSALLAASEELELCTEIIAEQCAFMEEHLSKWVAQFDEKLQEKAGKEGSLFYMAVSGLTKAFVLFDHEILRSLID